MANGHAFVNASPATPSTSGLASEPVVEPSTWASLKRIMRLARPELRLLALATVALLFSAGLNLAYPRIVGLIIDSVKQSAGTALDSYALILLVLFAVGSVFTALRSYWFTVAGERVVMRLRRHLYESLIGQDIGFFDHHRTGELTNRLAADTTVVQNAATVNLSMLLRFSLTAVGSVGIMLTISWRLTLVMLALVPVAVGGALVYGRIVKRLSRQVQDAQARSTEVAEETLAGIRTVRAFAREPVEADRYGARVNDAFELARERARVAAWFGGIAGFAGYGAVGGVLWYGGILLADPTSGLTVGDLTSFMIYTFAVAVAIGTLGTVWQDFMRAIGASERVFELIDAAPPAQTDGQTLAQVDGRVALSSVDFAYPTRPDRQVLHNVSLNLDPGEVVALVGPSGGGKSTVATLLARFYEPTAGALTLDGHDLRALDPHWLRQQIGGVAQEPMLFAASIADNIRYGALTATDDEVRAAAQAANAESFIDDFPEGFDTQVGERGVQLSGGQKQRVAIARALLKDPKVLVLDEATSALDAESEHLVQKALEVLMQGRTTLVIAHRLSTVRSADRVVVIDGGRVVQQGSHEALMDEGGLYRQLVERSMVE
ncbi:MAG: ABC transporter ATP-binding protein [Bradymonadia bacterium]